MKYLALALLTICEDEPFRSHPEQLSILTDKIKYLLYKFPLSNEH